MSETNVPQAVDLLAAQAARRPDAPAITHLRPGKPPRSWTWSELHREADVVRQRVHKGWPERAIVPVFAGKSLELVALMAGVMSAERTFAGISPKFRGPQIRHVVRACRSRHAIADSTSLPVLRDALQADDAERTLWHWLDAAEASPAARAAAQTLEAAGSLKQGLPDRLEVPQRRPMATIPGSDEAHAAVCLFTSGSTGTPKGVLIAWADLIERARAECALYKLTEQDVLLSLLPFSFDVGLNQLLSAWVSGAHLVMLDSWLPTDILNAVERHGVSGVSGVPSVWLSLLKSPLSVDTHGKHRSWRYLTVSGGSLTPAQLQDLSLRAPGIGIFRTYGQTESFRSTALEPADIFRRPNSVGRAFGTAKVYVVRDDGRLASPHEMGEVVHTGLGVMLGYLNPSEGDRKRRPNPFRGSEDSASHAIYTGDQGYLDDDGFLHLAGRNDDMVKISGNRVHLAELATLACSLPDVLAAEAVAVPQGDEDPGIVLFIVPKSDAVPTTSAELLRLFNRQVPTYMAPKCLELLEAFPLTASGKADRPILKQRAIALLEASQRRGQEDLAVTSSPKGFSPCP